MNASDLFDKALNSGFLESEEKKVELIEEDPVGQYFLDPSFCDSGTFQDGFELLQDSFVMELSNER